MRKLLVFLCFCVFVVAADFSKEFADFDKNYKNTNYENKLKLHHSLKNIYIKTIIGNDEKTKIKVLERLVLSADNLGLDSSLYKNDLNTLYKKYPNEKKKPTTTTQTNTTKAQNKTTQQVKQDNAKHTKFENTNSKKQPQDKKNKTTQTNDNLSKAKEENNKTIYILNSSYIDNVIKLNFNTNDIKEPKYHTFTNNGFISHIYTFENIVADKNNQFEFDLGNASLVQYTPKDARLVIRSKKEIDINIKTDGNFLSFAMQEKTKHTKFDEKTKQKQEELSQNKQEKNTSKDIKNDIKHTKFDEKTKQKQEELNKNKQEEKISKNDKEQDKQIYILQSLKTSNEIKLHFNTKNIQEPKYHTFKSKNINYYVYSFENVIIEKQKQFDFKDIKASLAQYNKNDARLVFSSAKTLELNLDFKDDLLVFDLSGKGNTKQTASKNQVKQSQNQENNPKQTKTSQNVVTNTNSLLSKEYRQKKLITIDAGHGGKDGGASFESRLEKNITLQISLKLKKELNKRGYKVYLTRSNDGFITLRNRTKIANDKMSDLFISIHANSVPISKKDGAYGIETYFLSPARSERSKNAAAMENKSDIEEMDYFSKQTFLNFLNREKIIASNKLAIDIQLGMLTNLKKYYTKDIKDGGVREAPFWVLVGALMPAVLIEVGYITHPIEGVNIANSTYQERLAIGIADGIDAYFSKNH